MPDGPHRVGTASYFWIDESRDEVLASTGGAKRHLLVQVWYPADRASRHPRSPYIQNPAEFGETSERIRRLFLVETNARVGAPLASDERRFPVILYSHGMGMPRFSSTFLMEHLASHGFVVFGIGHSFFDGTVVYPDGYRPVERADPETARAMESGNSEEGRIEVVLRTLAADTDFVLTAIERLNGDPNDRFHGRLDLERTGICGWSIGGINAAQMCRRQDRLRAGVNLDGLVGMGVVKGGVDKPFMLLKSGVATGVGAASLESTFLTNSTHDTFRLTIAGAVHTSFADLALLDASMAGEIDTIRCFEIVGRLVAAFFDRYVNGNEDVEIEREAGRYPEVTTERF